MIPSFAVGRTQEILYFIREIKERICFRNFRDLKYMWTVRLQSKLRMCLIKSVKGCFDEEAMELVNQGINPLLFRGSEDDDYQ